MVTKIKDDI